MTAVPAAAAPGRLFRTFPALASPVYRRFLLGSMIATVGGFMQQTAQGWLVLVLMPSSPEAPRD